MLKVVIPQDIHKLIKQIAALKWQIKQDTNDKDREIHKKALDQMQQTLDELKRRA